MHIGYVPRERPPFLECENEEKNAMATLFLNLQTPFEVVMLMVVMVMMMMVVVMMMINDDTSSYSNDNDGDDDDDDDGNDGNNVDDDSDNYDDSYDDNDELGPVAKNEDFFSHHFTTPLPRKIELKHFAYSFSYITFAGYQYV